MPLVSFLQKTDDDARLMLAYAGGDAGAFETLYRRHKDALYRYFVRQCGDRAAAEELYQDVWLRVIRARENYRHDAKFTTWLYRIAHNVLVDHFRKSTGFEAGDGGELAADPAGDPETVAAGQEKLRRFRSALENLPQEQREVFLLREEAGLNLEEIARLTGENFETAKSRLRYAVKKLRQSLDCSE